MKRKLFTLLFALVALASFQVSAQTAPKWWIKADTTGIEGNLPYGGNKVSPLPNWLVYTTPDSAGINTSSSILNDGAISKFYVTAVPGSGDRMLNIQSAKSGANRLKLSYGTGSSKNTWEQFEVVQFDYNGITFPPYYGGVRDVQQLLPTGVEGYLLPAQGNVNLQDTTPSLYMVVADNNQQLHIKRFEDVFDQVTQDLRTYANATQPGAWGNGTPMAVITSWSDFLTNRSGGNLAAINTAIENAYGAGVQQPLTTTATGYSRNVAYLSDDPLNASLYLLQITDPRQVTEFKNGAWTNGLPKNYGMNGSNDIPTTAVNDGYGASNGDIYVIVVESLPVGGTLTPPTKFPLGDIKYSANAVANQWRPVYIKLETPTGRWATTADFIDCKYWDFNLPVAKDPVKLAKGEAYETTSIFRVTQVDWVSRTTATATAQSQENIFGNTGETNTNNGEPYYQVNFIQPNVGGDLTGLQRNAVNPNTPGVVDDVIPLFILSSPENSCKVVSVSRTNDLSIQRQPDGLYGNRLELRTYGQYYDWHKSAAAPYTYTYSPHTASASADWDAHSTSATMAGTPVLREDRVATSLQKFAIWITEDGEKTIYPVASYFWKYGEDKREQPSTVLPNSVLMYNNPKITQTTGSSVPVADQGWGVQIDTWTKDKVVEDGKAVTPEKNDIVTGPNQIQQSTDYAEFKLTAQCYTPEGESIEGRFFFLQASDLKATGSGTLFSLATRANAYQDADKTEYVLSTECTGGTKTLVVVPKERVRRYDNQTQLMTYNELKNGYKRIENKPNPAFVLDDYWTINPYDSVNMAAHWGIYPGADGKYLLINMLGDTLQYALPNGTDITGGYLTANNLISNHNVFSPANGFDGQWFGQNTSSVSSKNLWTVNFIPGSEEGEFVLSLDGYEMTLNTGNWYQNGRTARKNANLSGQDSIYFQQGVTLTKSQYVDDNDYLYNHNTVDPDNNNKVVPFVCAGGLVVKKEEIYYVPNFSASYKGETDKDVINTNDPNFVDRNARVERDSLTAYLLLDGFYGIEEATNVGNGLFLNAKTNEDKRDAAVFSTAGAKNIQFIPLVSVVRERNANMRKALNSTVTAIAPTDTLYGETYKWFLVKLGDKYLVYDTLNLLASNDHLKLGFVFKKVDIANATPVRLYQPLVGDKLQGNFLFQFYAPVNYYDVADNTKTHRYSWNSIYSSINRDGSVDRLFGQLSTQSNYIHGVHNRNEATRFTYDYQDGTNDCYGCEEFIDPKWMASEKIVNFNVSNQVWIQSGASGFAMKASLPGVPVDGVVNRNATLEEAIVADYPNKDFSKIKHVYVDSIKSGVWSYNRNILDETASAPNNVTGSKAGFISELDVALYYVRDSRGYYLTVDTTTYQYNRLITTADVTGVNLVWKSTLNDFNSDPKLNKRALQLFAITGIPSSKLDQQPDGNWYTDCGTFVYLPLASYKVDYTQGKVLQDEIFYNLGLGKSAGYDKCNDPSGAFRVSQYSLINRNQKNLVVVNSTSNNTSIIPVEFKWKKEAYDKVECDYALVQDITKSTDKFYYASGGAGYSKLCYADSNTILAHWTLKHNLPTKTDDQIHNFTPETIIGYGKNIPENTQLKGDFYFKWNPERTELTAIGFDRYDWTTKYRTDEYKLDITCVKADLPFANLEKAPLGYSLPEQLAILEAPFVDRNLTDYTPGLPNNLLGNGNNHYQTYVNLIGDDINQATYLTTYLIQKRALTKEDPNLQHIDGEHVIPYYAFSIKRVNPADNKEYEYFLNVNTKLMNGGLRDSVHWTTLTPVEYADLMAGKNNMQLFQFCLPYQVQVRDGVEDGVAYKKGDRKSVEYPKGSGKHHNPVYLQTLDTARIDYPYLVITGASTQYVTAKNLFDAMNLNTGCSYTNGKNSLDWNIYTVDYSQIDPLQVTAWIFAGQQPGDHEWVPLRNANGVNPYEDPNTPIAQMNTEGFLTNFKDQASAGQLGFVAESKQSPVNYGMLLGATKLFFEYEGQEKIGTMWQLPIYYYRIQIEGADATKKWLTDSYYETSANYIYPWTGSAYQIAYFGDKITDNLSATKAYDKKYVQTFGLRYTKVNAVSGKYEVGDDRIPEKTFTVVSNANFEAPVPNQYRYLADVNGHLVFVENIENAMLFQFGKNLPYTNIEVVGQAEVFGVSGGVRLLNQTGAVGLYTIDGRLIKSVDVTSADQTITAPRGIVIVKADGKATKVVVK